MKSIEERARQHALAAVFGDENDSLYKYIETECVKLAKEQRKIDIERAAAWWESRCDYLGISKYQIELFKKAMEEGV